MDGVSFQTEVQRTPSKGQLISFSSTNFGKSLFWTMADVFCLVFATDTLGIQPAFAGLIILLTLVWDAVSDPLAGTMVDRWPSLNRSYGTIIRRAAPFSGLSLILIFMTQFWPREVQIASLLILLLCFRTAFTLIDIPDNALFSRIARTKSQRIFTASARKLMATLAAIAVSSSTAWIFSDDQPLSEGERILIAASIGAPLAMAALSIGSTSMRGWDRTGGRGAAPGKLLSARHYLNSGVLGLTAHMLLSSLGMAVFMSALVFHARFVLGNDTWFATAMTVFLLSQAAGVVLWSVIATKMTLHQTLLGSGAVSILAIAVFFGTSSNLMMIGACALFGCCAGGLNTLRWALAPSVIDQAEDQIGRRNEAAIMALFSLSIKTAIGLASVLVGLALSLSGYEPDRIATDAQAVFFQWSIASSAILAIFFALLPISANLSGRQ